MAMNPEVAKLGNVTIYFGTAAPTGGTGVAAWPQFQIGDIMLHSDTPNTGEPIFWRCSVASTAAAPAGTWVSGPNYT